MFRKATAALFVLGLAATPALAGDEQAATGNPQVAAATDTAEAKPERERRLTTVERWRGKPYLSSRARGRAQGEDAGRLLVDQRQVIGFESAAQGEDGGRLLSAPALRLPSF